MMTRLRVTIGLLCATTLGAAGASAEDAAAPRPNMIYILADDLGYGDLGCYGQRHFETPHIDRMAAEGMRFTQHYAGSTVCAPSRACLLTGQHTGHVYQRANGQTAFREDPQDVCLAAVLKQGGYHTAMIGKSGLSCNSDDGALPNRKGFDHFFGYTSHLLAHRYYPPFLWRNGSRVDLAGNEGTEGEQYSGDLFLAEAIDYLEQRAEDPAPFFLHLSLQQPHADLSVPQEWRSRYLGKFEERPGKPGGYRAEPNPKATFAAMVAYLDDSVGQVLRKLEEKGMRENTLVLFSSDNGAMSEGGWSRKHFNSSGPLRGGKRDLYEGGIRVPFIAWWPGVVEAGAESEHLSAFWDFAPTACELAGAPCPEKTDGVSFAPTLTGSGHQTAHQYLYWEFHELGGKQAVRWGDWKGVRLRVNRDLDGPLALYNLRTDLGESEDVAAEHPEVVARLRGMMTEAHTPGERFRFRGEAAPGRPAPAALSE